MSTPKACFSALPPELRIPIWEDALSVRSIWAVVTPPYYDYVKEEPAEYGEDSLVMKFMGPAAYLPGGTCRESRWVMKQQGFQQVTLGGDTGPWINPDNTIVHFGELWYTSISIPVLAHAGLPPVKYVATSGGGVGADAEERGVARLAKSFKPESIIYLDRFVETIDAFTPELRAYYIAISRYHGPQINTWRLHERSGWRLQGFRHDIDRYSYCRLHLVTSRDCDGVDSVAYRMFGPSLSVTASVPGLLTPEYVDMLPQCRQGEGSHHSSFYPS